MDEKLKVKILIKALYTLVDEVRDWPDDFEYTYEQVIELINEYEKEYDSLTEFDNRELAGRNI